jgi:hypothetical protein
MQMPRRRKCRHCLELFKLDPRNAAKQKYCSKPECQRASKSASQRKWLTKPENKNYFQGPDNIRRVQEWRKRNPGYWRENRPGSAPLQDHSNSETMEKRGDTENLTAHALQDLLSAYQPVLLGFLAHFTGFTLQDDIVNFGRRLQQLGQDILTEPSTCRGGRHDNQQTSHPARHGPPDSRSVQLD